ncbi:MAG: alanine--tRNA ligase [Candidatus Omnitrophota bacterium]
MTTDELRKIFLSFFESKGHAIVPSDSLVPKDDPTVLFTSAGMNQFKDYFLGKRKDLKRAASCQKCLRTGDIEKVGQTPAHHTFFEMLGNFSFGDYFKDEAIAWGWEFMTKTLNLKEKDLWVSVYVDDDEAYKIWRDKIRVPEDKILKFGAEENFWPSNAPQDGPDGPCGPCSEIYYDQGVEVGCGRPDCNPGCDCGRFVEVWNLVFTQFNRVGVNKLEPLPSKNIDTGMGLERLASVMQGKRTNFETDVFKPIVNGILNLIDEPKMRSYATREGLNHLNAIADHIRATVFCIADGVLPSNVGRGYVLRSLIRRAIVHAKFLTFNKPFLYKLVDAVVRAMKGGYPEIEARRENISLIIKSEEEKFFLTSEVVQGELDILLASLREQKKDTISGEEIFYFHDTRGLPVELIKEVAAKENLKLNLNGYEKLMEEQRVRSRGATRLTGEIFAQTLTTLVTSLGIKTEFVGYEKLECDATIKAIMKDNKIINEVTAPADIAMVLDVTPFYGETGGQVGDTGVIEGGGFKIEVYDTKLIEKTQLHLGKLKEGKVKIGDKVKALVDKKRRQDIARHHTATHLLQAALRTVLGPHVQQSGSLVAPDRLRFDFTHFKAIDEEQLNRIEDVVNEYIRRNDPLKIEMMDLDEARRSGATALFGEKYDKRVRVITIGDYSKELCGGTHLKSTGEIGILKIIGEGSVAAGLRRIEAIAGEVAFKRIKESEEALKTVAEMLKTEPSKLPSQIEKLIDRIKGLERQLKNYEFKNLKEKAKELVSMKEFVDNKTYLVAKRLDDFAPQTLVNLTDEIKANLVQGGISILGGVFDGKPFIVAALTRDLVKRGMDARAIIGEAAKVIAGGGGGRPDLAQAGGKDVSKLDEALKIAKQVTRELIK